MDLPRLPPADPDPSGSYFFWPPHDAQAYAEGGVAAAYERMLADVIAGFEYSFGDFWRGKYELSSCYSF